MAISDYDNSVNRGQPAELYLFRYGSDPGAYYAYTNATQPITHNEIEFTPLPFDREKFVSDGKVTDTEMQVTVPRNSDVAELFRIYPPASVVTLTIWDGYIPNEGDPPEWASDNFKTVWTGKVTESVRPGANVTLTCELTSVSMNRPGLRRHYQWPCSLVLYGPRCKANKAIATVTRTVANVGGNTVTLTSGWVQEGRVADDYIGGLLEWVGDGGREFRMIRKVVGNTLNLSGPTRGLLTGSTVDVVLGCPHTMLGCASLHQNTINYGGHPFIPTVNPVGKNNHY